MELKPGYKQTEVGLIPEDWDVRPLLTTVRIANGQVDPKTEPYKSMVLVAPDHIESATGRLLDQQTAAEQRAISGKYLFSEGDIVYSKIRPYLRKAILAEFSGLCSADMYPLKPANDVSAGFMLAVLLGHRFSKYAESVSVRSGMPKINRAELAEYVVALPPHLEQRAIAGVLSDVGELIGALDQLIAKKRDLKQATMQQLLTGQKRLPGFHGKWEVKRLEKSCEMITKGTTPTSIGRNFTEAGVNFLKAESISDSGQPLPEKVAFIDTATHKLLKRSQLKEGDLLISIAGVLGRVGRVSRDILPANTNQALAIVRLGNSPELERSFLFYYLLEF